MRVQDKVTLITGPGTGIGKETAHIFAKEGAKLILTDVNVEGVRETEKEVKELGAEAISIKHDVSKEEEIHLIRQGQNFRLMAGRLARFK